MKRTVEQLVKGAFDGEKGVSPEHLAALKALAAHEAKKRARRRRWAPTLLAASLAAALVLGVHLADRSDPRPATVKDAIGLLCEIDGISKEELAGKTAGEMLLVWQEAPCRDLL